MQMDGSRSAIAAPKLVERRVERLADRVPKRTVNTGLRAHREFPVAQDVGARLAHELPAALDVKRVLADQQRLDLVEDDLDNLALGFEFVAVVDLADDPRRGVHPRNDRAAMRHEVVAAAKRARKRHAERHAFDAFNLQLRRHRMPNYGSWRNAIVARPTASSLRQDVQGAQHAVAWETQTSDDRAKAGAE